MKVMILQMAIIMENLKVHDCPYRLRNIGNEYAKPSTMQDFGQLMNLPLETIYHLSLAMGALFFRVLKVSKCIS